MVKGTNSAIMKEKNKKLILGMIRKERCSRAAIAERTGLTRASVTMLVEELIADGFVLETEAQYSGVGRRPINLELCPEGGLAIGVALTRNGWSVGMTDLCGQLIQPEKHGSVKHPVNEVLQQIAEAIKQLVKIKENSRILGVGVASPGPVDYRMNQILNPPNFGAWHGAEIGKRLSEMCGVAVRLENVSNASALAEAYFGECTNEENYCYLIVDEGIGSGIVVNGKLYRGKNGYGSELGHTSIDYKGRACECGNIGCLEKYASIPAVLTGTSYQTWQEAVDAQDENLIQKEAGYLSGALVNLINLFDLNKIILGGDLAYQGEWISEQVSEQVNRRIITNNLVKISAGKRLDKTVVAASVALNSLFW